MILVDRNKIALAVEALTVAAKTACDRDGMRIVVRLPQKGVHEPLSSGLAAVLQDRTDYDRIQAIALAAVVSLIGQPVGGFTDEVEVTFGTLAPPPPDEAA